VKIGPFSRSGRCRVAVAAADHDFQPAGTVTPVGLLLPALDELFLDGVTSRVTSDCLVDRLAPWWATVRARFAHVTTLVRNLDNGPENHSHRTQFVARLVPFAADAGLTIRLPLTRPTTGTVKLSLLGTDGGPKMGNDRLIEDRIWLVQALATARTGSVWGGFVQSKLNVTVPSRGPSIRR